MAEQDIGFSARRTIKIAAQQLLAPPDKVFPLLCPTREYDWITGLNEEGNRLLAGLTDEAYRQKISILERLLNHYLTTGKMLQGGV